MLSGIFRLGKHVGNVILSDINWSDKSAYVGIAIFKKNVWGQGIGFKALEASVEIALDILGIVEILAGVDVENIRSQKIFKRAEFEVDKHIQNKWSYSR